MGANALNGIIRWIDRAPWTAAHGELLGLFLAPVCDQAGVGSIDELGEAVGPRTMRVIWGIVFEEFLCRDLDFGNPVDDYLKRRGWKERPATRAYLAALRASRLSLFEISDIRPNESFLARDLVYGGAPVRVPGDGHGAGFAPWDHVATRLLDVRGVTEVSNVLLRFPRGTSDVIVDALRLLLTDPDDGPLASALIPRLLFTSWLADELDDEETQFVDHAGDPLCAVTVSWPLKSADSEAARTALESLPALRPDAGLGWLWVSETRPRGTGGARVRETVVAGRTADGATILGTLELGDGDLRLHAGTEARAERGGRMVEGALGALIGEASVERFPADAVPAMPPRGLTEIAVPEPDAGGRARVREAADAHYRARLDRPVPMLGDVTPRRAASTPDGRERLAAWLKIVESHCARLDPSEPLAGYDPTWMWDELGIAELRR